ncbi:MAG: hypothetical protein MK212_18100 [Saprospiraceae bacterium]|nr:hypothetical protein [Saprospiraceae bacterium]
MINRFISNFLCLSALLFIFNVSQVWSQARMTNISQAEYFWDTDPGEGNGTAINAADGTFEEAIEQALSTDAVGQAAGIHSFNIRMLGADGTWSPVFTTVMEVATAPNTSGRSIQLTQAEYFWDADPGEGNGTALLDIERK